MRRTPQERFWSKVNKDGPVPAHMPHLGPCWAWTGHVSRWNGYGQFRLSGRIRRAHGVSWEFANGAEANLHVLHSCDNRTCVNPAHLWLGNDQQNHADMRKKGRWEGRIVYKLTPRTVAEIRAKYGGGMDNQRALASEYGVALVTIHNIVRRRTWTAVA